MGMIIVSGVWSKMLCMSQKIKDKNTWKIEKHINTNKNLMEVIYI